MTGPALLALLAAVMAGPIRVQAFEKGPEVRFETAVTTVWLGRSAVIPVRVADPLEYDATYGVTVDDASIVEVLRPAEIVSGRVLGSLRVRALDEGETRLSIGAASIQVRVRSLPAEARLREPRPAFVAPVHGAVVWGTFAVCVEVACVEPAGLAFELVLPDGRRLDPRDASRDSVGPRLAALFDVDATDLAPGQQVLRARILHGERELGRVARVVTVAHDVSGLLVGECEDALDAPRPEAFGAESPRAGMGAGASGAGFVLQPRSDPQWVGLIEVPASGLYQLMVTARGDPAGGALPSIGVGVDEPYPLAGAARLVDRGWHRIPVGPPFALEAGTRGLGLRFLNDLDVGPRSNRRMDLDRWELLPINDAASSPVEASARTSMAMMSSMMSMEPDERGASGVGLGPGLWVALDRPLDGLAMNGRLTVQGESTWSGPDDSPAPRVELVVDGEVRARQQTARPTFELDRAHLGAGEHVLSLRATLSDGRVAETAHQRLRVEGPVAEVPGRDFLRYDVLDERWNGKLVATLDGQNEESRQRVARPRTPVEATLDLPDALTGAFDVLLEARGPDRGEASEASVWIEQGGVRGEARTREVRNWWNFHSFGQVDLEPGRKRLQLRLEPREGDPRLSVRSVALRAIRPTADRSAPHVRLAYPPDGHMAYGVDAVVVEAFDDDALDQTDLLIDGRPQGSFGYVPRGAGPVVLPLLLRGIAPGEHTLAVRVSDRDGNLGETAPITFTVAGEAPAEPGPYARAVHLLDRLAFGPEPVELAEVLTVGEEAWLREALWADGPGDLAARELAGARLADRLGNDGDRLLLSWALRTDNPLRARLVLWVDDHFSTWVGKTGMPSEWREHAEYARLGPAPFGELLFASVTSPTMLVYLDQPLSYAGRINENYARELLELHTVGVDAGYAQEDVTELARLLAGLTVSEEAPEDGSGQYLMRVLRYDPHLADGRECTVFGRRFDATAPEQRFDRLEEALELLAGHPATARFVATKLAGHAVAVPPPEQLVDDLTIAFLENGGDLRAVVEALVAHPAFWTAADERRTTSPLDYALRVGRACGVPQVDWSMRAFLRSSGMGLFDRATPDGYPDDDLTWSDTNSLLQRWRWVQQIPWAVRALVPDPARHYAGGDVEAWWQRCVDHAAVRLTGRTLGAESNAAALSFLEGEKAQPWQKVDELTVLVCRLPEANLR